jgi:WD40 repeat protein
VAAAGQRLWRAEVDEQEDRRSDVAAAGDIVFGDGGGRPDLFISYSRVDAAFVRRLDLALQSRGNHAWVDYGEIRRSEDWWAAIVAGIDASRIFVSVLSPELVESEVCGRELEQALSSNKRIVPILHREIDRAGAPAALTRPDWIFFREADTFEDSVGGVEAIETDLEWVDEHARLLVRAKEWEHRGRDRSRLLRGRDLADAERWLSGQGMHNEAATALQAEYIVAGRAAASRRQRLGFAAVMVALVVSLALTALALVQRRDAIRATKSATSLALASASREQLPDHVDIALLLGLEAYRAKATPQAANSMVSALEAARPAGMKEILHDLTGRALEIAFSPDGHTLASDGSDEPTRLWNLRTHGELGGRLTGPSAGLHALAFSPDGRTLAGAGGREAIWLIDVRTHRRLGGPLLRPEANGGGYIKELSFSPDGRTLVSAADDGVQLWTVSTHRRLGRPLNIPGSSTSAAFSPDGRTLATASNDGIARLWNLDTRTELAEFERDGAALVAVAFSPDGHTLAVTDGSDTVHLWNPRTPRVHYRPLRTDQSVARVIFSRDGRTIATVGGSVRLWDARTHRRLGAAPTGPPALDSGVAFSDGGRTLVVAGSDGTVRLWDVRTLIHGGRILGVGGNYGAIAFSPDGRRLAAGSGGDVRMWDTRTDAAWGRPLVTGQGPVVAVGFSPDGRTIATAGVDGSTVRLWNAQTFAPQSPPLRGHYGLIHAVAFSLDGRTLASASDNGVQLWDAHTHERLGKTPRPRGHLGRMYSPEAHALAFSPDSQTLASAGVGVVLFWNVQTHANLGLVLTNRFRLGTVGSVAFNSSGHRLLTSNGSDLQLWEAHAHTQVGRPLTRSSDLGSAVFTANDRVLAFGAANGTVGFWDLRTNQSLGTPIASKVGGVEAIAVSPDEHLLAVAGSDGKVRLLDGIVWSDRGDLEKQVCGLVHGALTRAEWAEHAPGLSYRTTCQG